MKKAKYNFEEPDLSRYHILTYDELLRVNGGSGSDSDDSDDEESEESGGHEIENTVEAVANAEVGDTLTRDDGTQVTITQGDIDWAQEHCDSYGKNEEAADSKEAAENAGSATENASESQQVDNSNEAVANAKPGDTITRSDGTEVVLTQEDIDWAKDHIDGKSGKADSSKEGETSKGNNSAESRTTNSGSKENDTEYVEKQEASRARAEEQLAARKNDELNNSPKGGHSAISSWWNKDEKAVLVQEERNIQRNIGLGEMVFGFAGVFFSGGYGVLPGACIMADGAIVFSGALHDEKVTPLRHFANDFASPAIDIPNSSVKYVSPF